LWFSLEIEDDEHVTHWGDFSDRRLPIVGQVSGMSVTNHRAGLTIEKNNKNIKKVEGYRTSTFLMIGNIIGILIDKMNYIQTVYNLNGYI
jgi:hypothetical protein